MMLLGKKRLVAVAGIFTFSGCLAGLVGTVKKIHVNEDGVIGLIFLLIPLLYFISGAIIASGIVLSKENFHRLFIWFWSIQVPVLNTSLLSFHAVTGAFCALWIRLDVLDVGFGFGIATQFQIDLMIEGPIAIGINIFAVVMVILMNVGSMAVDRK